MAVFKRVLRKDRLRQVPHQFSWIDHRLVRDRHTSRCSADALALYLFLVTVADGQGLSYYGDGAVCRLLPLDVAALFRARQELIANHLIAYERPLYQVLALPASGPSRSPAQTPVPTPSQPRASSRPSSSRPSPGRPQADKEQPGQPACPHSIAQIIQRMMEAAKP
jgi:hypothetical protein